MSNQSRFEIHQVLNQSPKNVDLFATEHRSLTPSKC
jgi:hypothetical protein